MTRALAAYPRRSTDKIRYGDTDRQGHVNNATFSTFLETGRVEVLYDPAHPVSDVGCEFVIARLVIEFRGEIHWPGAVSIGTGVQRIGTSSMTFEQVIEQEGACVAYAESVIVQIDTTTRAARPLSAATRERLSALLLP